MASSTPTVGLQQRYEGREPNQSSSNGTASASEFEVRRQMLIEEIGDSFEVVLQRINTLNRSLEGIIAIGNEFGSVEALWSQFENLMGKDHEAEGKAAADQEAAAGGEVDGDSTIEGENRG